MTDVYYNRIIPTSWTADEEATGYEATNLDSPRVGQEWRSTSTGQVDLELDLGGLQSVALVVIQRLNRGSVNLYWRDKSGSPDTETSASFGATTDDLGNLRVHQKSSAIGLGAAANVTHIGIQFLSGTPTDGESFWRMGAVHVFGSKVTLDRGVREGARIGITEPGQASRLANGLPVKTATGAIRHQASFTHRGQRFDDLGELVRLARAGIVAADLGARNNIIMPWEWKQTTVDTTVHASYYEFNGTLDEVV